MKMYCLLAIFFTGFVAANEKSYDAKIEWTVNFDERNMTMIDDENYNESITVENVMIKNVKEGSPKDQKPKFLGKIKKQSFGSTSSSIAKLIRDVEALKDMDDKLLAKISTQSIDILKNQLEIRSLKNKVGGSSSSSSYKPSYTPKPKPTCDGLIYQGRCYFGIFYLSGRMNYAEAEDICAEKGAVVGHFRRVDHYNKMIKLLRNELERITPDEGLSTIINSFLWLGMKINWSTEKVATVAGGPLFQLWKKNYPTPRASYTAVYFEVDFYDLFGKPEEGMKNTSPTSRVNGVLCEKPY